MNAVKDRPILFSAPMVRAILEGRKTQTRRIVKLHGKDGLETDHSAWRFCEFHGDRAIFQHIADIQRVITELCPYGKPGDRLWVRESHALDGKSVFYRMGHEEAEASGPRVDIKWRSSIHMHRWASRILLEIADVRVQRLQEISEEDVRAEGVPWRCVYCKGTGESQCDDSDGCSGDGQYEFRNLWNSINGKKPIDKTKSSLSPRKRQATGLAQEKRASFDVGWDANPWIWAITFKRVEAAERAA